MDRNYRQPKPDELFFKPSTPEPETPTVGPLRINKASPPSRNSSTGAILDGQQYQPPARTTQSPPYPDDRPKPLSSPRPVQTMPGAERKDERRPTPNGRARFAASDPNRPTISGYSQSPPPALKPGGGRGNTPKPLPESHSPETPEDGDDYDDDDDDDDLFQRAPMRPAVPAVSAAAPQATLNQSTYQQYYPPPSDAEATLTPPQPAGVNRFSSVSTTRAERGSPPPPETPILGRPGGGDSRYPPAAATSNTAAAQRLAPYGIQAPRPSTMSPPQQDTRRPWTPTEQPGSNPYGPPAVYQGMDEVPTPVQTSQPQQPTQPTQSPQPASYQQPLPYQQPASLSAQHPASLSAQQPAHTAFHDSPQPIQHQAPLQNSQNNANSRFSFMPQSGALEQDMGRLNMGEEPPPAYSSVHQAAQNSGSTTAQGYPNEKRSSVGNSVVPQTALALASAQDPNLHRHPAFAQDGPAQTISPSHPAAAGLAPIQIMPASSASPGPIAGGPASPPPLPEGWIAHLDPNSGQYYYIHLPTQLTQWEFPKGPTPLKMNEPMSPTGTFVAPLASPAVFNGFGGQAMMSPGFQPQTPFSPAMSNMGSLASPTVAGFSGPPPTAGVDNYKIQPTNGVYFGPYLRYTNMDLERALWLGSILLVTDVPNPPTIHIHQSNDLSPNPRQLKANQIFTHQRWVFYRYDIDLIMEEQAAKWTYAITSHLGCTRYEFLVAGRYEASWRFIAHSGNDFALNVGANERSRLGGVGLMWKDVLQKHVECGGFHAQLGLGGQIYGDRLWKDIPALKQWTGMSGKENRKNAPWTATHEEDVLHAYFHYYTSHFDQPHVREAFAQIPHVMTLDDNEIFDGYGSYPEYMQQSHMFRSIGRIGIDMYLLFQHHTTHEILRAVNNDMDLFTVTGTGWHFVKYLGPSVVVVGPDTRSERDCHRVMAGPTYQGLFPKVALLPPSVQHCIWMIPVPLLYPRLEAAETLAHTMATGKKAVTGTFNMLGRMTSSVAGVVGAKGVVGDGFSSIKRAVGKSGLMSNVLSPFGEIDMLDELRDMWTHESKDLERTYMIRTLQGIAHNKSLRMTFLSGSVDACGAGLVHDPAHPGDHKTMYQLIASSIVNAPPPSYVLRLLNQNPKQPIYIPQNGHRSTSLVGHHGEIRATDTKEDMMEIFVADVNGAPRDGQRKLMGRRNYVALVAYDPESVQTQFGGSTPGSGGGSNGGMEKASQRLSLAADFMVQNESAYAQPVKYGPVIIPSLDFGR